MTPNAYDQIAEIYTNDMAASMPFDDASYYLRAAQICAGKVVELGCGSGRILSVLHRAGVDITGVDRSSEMLTIGRRLVPEANFLESDMRQFALARQFSLALMPYALATYLLSEQDWLNLSSCLASCMLPGALVIIDSFLPKPMALDTWLHDYSRKLPTRDAWLVRFKRLHDFADGSRQIERRYRLKGFNQGQTLHTCERVRPYTLQELVKIVGQHVGVIERLDFDYGRSTEAQSARFVSLWVRLRR
jgi:ubiquinone/menaquinone biosynthesis C-methylase UbiE